MWYEDRKFFSLEAIEYELNVFDYIYWKTKKLNLKNEKKLFRECLLEWAVKEK